MTKLRGDYRSPASYGTEAENSPWGPKVGGLPSTVSSRAGELFDGLLRRTEIVANGVLLIGWRKRWNRNLLRFLGSRARQPDIDDLAQETYLRLLRAPDLREVRNPEAYLISVASHVVTEWRQRQPPADSFLPGADVPAERSDPALEVEARISQRRIDEVLAKLSPMMRAVLLLRLRDDRSCKDIAEDLGLTQRQVKRQLAHGYDLLRRALE